MPPILPKTPAERWQMWGNARNFEPPLRFDDPMEPANHLDEETQRRVALFPEMSNLLLSRFGLSRTNDQEWFPVRPLGQGGFGGVAVWERRDSAGNVVEETAVKQSKWSREMALAKQPYIAKEAAIMQQLNKKKSEYIVYMKSFKCFHENEKAKTTWRFYFEYCPHGDLSRLEKRYRAWGTYLPEEFLWNAFHSMAQVAQIMAGGGYKDLETGAPPKVRYVLIHSDIKPLNIFLGYHAHPNSPWHVYPVVKVGDFGLASFTNVFDPANPQKFVKNGTTWFLPPESRAKRDTRKYEDWEVEPFNLASFRKSELERTEYNPDYTDRKVDSSHNVWAFGLTMHGLLTHESAYTFSERLNAMTEDEYNAWGQNTMPTIQTHKQPEYSYELRDLVRKCLNLRPSLRPTVEQILDITRPVVERYQAEVIEANTRMQQRFPHANYTYQLPKLYFKENEINNMPLGPHLEHFGYKEKHQAAFAFDEDKYAAAIWGPILHPNRAQFAHHYQQLVQKNKQGAQNANGKRAQIDDDTTSIRAPPPKRNRLPSPARRPANLYGGHKGLQRANAKRKRKVPVVGQDHHTRPARVPDQQAGFIAINNGRAQRGVRQRPGVLDTIDEALLASRPEPRNYEQSRRNVRNRRMRLWNDQVVPDQGNEEEEEEEEEEDVSMSEY